MSSKKKTVRKIFSYIVLIALGYVMIYPLLWMFFATFKTNLEIFGNSRLWPNSFSIDAYIQGWSSIGQYTYTTYFINTLKIVIPVVVFTVISCTVIAYGFARFNFIGKRVMFFLMIATLMLPSSVLIIPRYLLFREFDWLDSYYPFIIPALCGNSFLIFMLIQFIRTLPKELDEAAYIDGCGPGVILVRIIVPLCKPAMFSVIVFQFLWAWNDFIGPLIYINSVKRYPLSMALKLTIDPQAKIAWSQTMAMSLLSIVPCIVLFFSAQKYFVEGIATSGLKS